MSEATPITSSPQPPKKSNASALVAAVIVVIGIICYAWYAFDSSTVKSDTATDSGPKLISKEQWMQKVRPYYNPGGGVKVTTVTNFKALMGEPSDTQVDGNTGHALWTYTCSDGAIQVDLIDPNMTHGTLAINSISSF